MGLEMIQIQNKLLDKFPTNKPQLHEMNVRLLIGLGVIFFYLLIGAVVFVSIESPAEDALFEEYTSIRSDWEDRLIKKGFAPAEIDDLFASIRYMGELGIWQEQNVTADPSWSFGRAFFFAGALLTTIGYGHISPRTPAGKLFTIVYCIVGIPLTLALLSALAHRLRYPSTWLRTKLNMKLGHLFHAIHLQWIHLFVVCGILFVAAFLIPSFFFIVIESDWTFIDAIYFCFVSLSTIGLGEYSPGDQPNQKFRGLYKFFVTVYLLFGLSCMMMFLATLYDIPQCNIARFFVTAESDDGGDDEVGDTSVHLHNGNQQYKRYDGETEFSPTQLPFTATNGLYQS